MDWVKNCFSCLTTTIGLSLLQPKLFYPKHYKSKWASEFVNGTSIVREGFGKSGPV